MAKGETEDVKMVKEDEVLTCFAVLYMFIY
jgi:hypothetical protein